MSEIALPLPAKAKNLAARHNVEQLEARARSEWKRLQGVARRAVKLSVQVGFTLIALRDKSPHGTWEPRLERLGIRQTTARRLISFALNAEFVLAALEQAPDLTQQGVEKLIAAREEGIAELRSDALPAAQAKVAIATVQASARRAREDSHAPRALAALKKAIGDVESLLLNDPQAPEIYTAITLLELKARSLRVEHEQAIRAEAPPAAPKRVAKKAGPTRGQIKAALEPVAAALGMALVRP